MNRQLDITLNEFNEYYEYPYHDPYRYTCNEFKKSKSSAKIILKQYSSYLLSEAAKTLACCFPVNFAKFLRTPFLQNTTGRLFLFFDDVIQTKL